MENGAAKKKSVIQYVRKVLWAWGPVVLWMLLIFTLSSRQRLVVSEEYILNFLFFKTLHVLEYAALYTWCIRAFRISCPSKKREVYIWAFMVTILYAASDELHQTMVPTREGTVRDVIIDGIGASVIWYFLSTTLQKAPKKLKNLARSLDLIF